MLLRPSRSGATVLKKMSMVAIPLQANSRISASGSNERRLIQRTSYRPRAAEAETADADVRLEAAPRVRLQRSGIVQPRSSSYHELRILLAQRVAGIMGRAALVERRIIDVLAPLPDVACQIEDAVRRRSTGKRADRLRALETAAEVGVRVLRLLFAPGILAAVGTARRLLPLCFGQQSLAGPDRVRDRILPRHEHHRMIDQVRRHLAATPVEEEAMRFVVAG